jgi:hypothetical protein
MSVRDPFPDFGARNPEVRFASKSGVVNSAGDVRRVPIVLQNFQNAMGSISRK